MAVDVLVSCFAAFVVALKLEKSPSRFFEALFSVILVR
jgi:hypothetical protein